MISFSIKNNFKYVIIFENDPNLYMFALIKGGRARGTTNNLERFYLNKGRRVKTVEVLCSIVFIYDGNNHLQSVGYMVGHNSQRNRKRSGSDMNNFGVKRVSLFTRWCLSMIRCNYYFIINYHLRVPIPNECVSITAV